MVVRLYVCKRSINSSSSCLEMARCKQNHSIVNTYMLNIYKYWQRCTVMQCSSYLTKHLLQPNERAKKEREGNGRSGHFIECSRHCIDLGVGVYILALNVYHPSHGANGRPLTRVSFVQFAFGEHFATLNNVNVSCLYSIEKIFK